MMKVLEYLAVDGARPRGERNDFSAPGSTSPHQCLGKSEWKGGTTGIDLNVSGCKILVQNRVANPLNMMPRIRVWNQINWIK